MLNIIYDVMSKHIISYYIILYYVILYYISYGIIIIIINVCM